MVDQFVAAPPGRGLVRPGLTRRHVIRGLGGLALAGMATTAYGIGVEPESVSVTRYRLTPPRWPPGQRLSIHVIADLHAGGPNMTARHINEVVEIANLESADLVLLLGDYFATHRFVTERVPPPVWAAALARLESRLGTWAVFGNHDWWHDIAGVRAAFGRVGIPTLENRAVLLGNSGRQFWLAGLGDQLAWMAARRIRTVPRIGVDDLGATLAKVTDSAPVILLAHEPDIASRVPARVALQLSGHTHGGQVRLFGWVPAAPSGRELAYGHIRGNCDVVVSGGLGCSIMPVRLGVPPEIVLVTLGGRGPQVA